MLHFRGTERASGVAMPRRRDVPGLASRVLGYQIKHSNKAIRQRTRASQAAGVSRSTDKLGTCDLEDWFALRGGWFAHDPRGPPPTADWIDDCMHLFPDTYAPDCLRAGGDGCLDLSTRWDGSPSVAFCRLVCGSNALDLNRMVRPFCGSGSSAELGVLAGTPPTTYLGSSCVLLIIF